MKTVKTQHLDRIVEFVQSKKGDNVSLKDVVSLAEITAESLSSFYASMDKAIYAELRDIALFISSMKQEIGALQANDLRHSRIPAAGMELSAIVASTEGATNQIMECAEAVMAADASDPEAYKALVDDKMMVIFEACSFQDITGQRISKVVETLQAIESRVARFASAVGEAVDEGGFASDEEAAKAERKARLILNGPALAGQGVGQDDVDAMFGGSSTSGQDDIDAMFK